jgi:hypothetical protein
MDWGSFSFKTDPSFSHIHPLHTFHTFLVHTHHHIHYCLPTPSIHLSTPPVYTFPLMNWGTYSHPIPQQSSPSHIQPFCTIHTHILPPKAHPPSQLPQSTLSPFHGLGDFSKHWANPPIYTIFPFSLLPFPFPLYRTPFTSANSPPFHTTPTKLHTISTFGRRGKSAQSVKVMWMHVCAC